MRSIVITEGCEVLKSVDVEKGNDVVEDSGVDIGVL